MEKLLSKFLPLFCRQKQAVGETRPIPPFAFEHSNASWVRFVNTEEFAKWLDHLVFEVASSVHNDAVRCAMLATYFLENKLSNRLCIACFCCYGDAPSRKQIGCNEDVIITFFSATERTFKMNLHVPPRTGRINGLEPSGLYYLFCTFGKRNSTWRDRGCGVHIWQKWCFANSLYSFGFVHVSCQRMVVS